MAVLSSSRLFLVFFAIASAVASEFPQQRITPSPWFSFKNLTGCRAGEHHSDLIHLKRYLERFGYLPATSNPTAFFDGSLETAIATYQHNFGLNATGELDAATVAKLMEPRCGVPDAINSASTLRGRNLYAYFKDKPVWPSSKTQLTYFVTDISAVSIDLGVFKDILYRVFSKWSAFVPITFAEAPSASEADLQIAFYNGDHSDGLPFDGPLNILAHAFAPTDGRCHFDAAETWVTQGDPGDASSDSAVDLESVALHEVGHLLGLAHTPVQEAVMYAILPRKTKKADLMSDDIDGIQALYGKKPTFKG